MSRVRFSILALLITLLFQGCVSNPKEVAESNPMANDAKTQSRSDVSDFDKQTKTLDSQKIASFDSQPSESEVQQLIRRESWPELEKYGLAKLQVNPKDLKALNLLGLVNYYKNKPQAAQYYFSRALDLSPGNGAILNNMGLVSRLEGNTRSAIVLWRQASEAKAGRSEAAQANLVTEFTKAKDYKKVMGASERIDSRKTSNVALLVNLGIGYMASNQHGMADRLFSRAVDIEDSNRHAILNYAILNIEHEKNLDLGRRQLDRLSFLGVQSDMQVTLNQLEKKLENVKSK